MGNGEHGRYEAVVVGGGAAGLAASRALGERGVAHVVLERGRIGESWRSRRWRSFRLNTPSWMNTLGDPLAGGVDPDGFASAPELVCSLEGYAARHGLPIVE